jgi:GNAT superfamily N-acetyltransferase
MSYRMLGRHYAWWRGDPLPWLPPLDGFSADRADDEGLLAQLNRLDMASLQARIGEGNHAYLAFVHGTPVAYGWCATQTARIIELALEWPMGAEDRNLWDFATLPEWRGRGVYPRLLQAILRAEAAEAQRFWIGHVADNTASRQGILKAGFQPTFVIVMTAQGEARWIARGNRERALEDPMLKHLGIVEQ